MRFLRLNKTDAKPGVRHGQAVMKADETGIVIYDDDGSEIPLGTAGKSAYQIARDHGYGGTESQWLATLKGAEGEKGATGDKGPDGDAGPQGSAGASGPQGDAGPQGQPGLAGEAGPAGSQGATGPVGDKGPTGDKGPSGDQGAAGPQGTAGPDGNQGPVGNKGPTGDTGTKGATGDKGPVGDKGPTGDAGPAGQQGPTGNAGPAGSAYVPVFADLGTGTALALATNDAVTVSPTANTTYMTTVPSAGRTRQVIVRQTTATSRTLTFGSGFKPVGTLATGTTAARTFVVSFVSDGTNLLETGRTAAFPT